MSYTINNEFALAANEGDSRVAQNLYIILHETGNLNEPSARNEASYMKSAWQNAYTQAVVGDNGIVYEVGEPGFVSWGALDANPFSPCQIELEHTTNAVKFAKNYPAYIEYARDNAKRFGIPLTLDSGGPGTAGVKTHWWVTQNYSGDHVDPYGYLELMGVSAADLANDIANGVGEATLKNGWAQETGAWYFYNEDGSLAKGWKNVGNVWYYLNPTDGHMHYSEWLLDNGKWYYLHENGSMAVGWIAYKDKWYFAWNNGEMSTGWIHLGNKWFLLNDDGSMVKGWMIKDNAWYHMAENGEMSSGWIQDHGTWFLCDNSGKMVTGWYQEGEKYFFLSIPDGHMVIGKTVINGKEYEFDKGGKCLNP
ncbi:N-acetylmuramoyl-L-alanine amidase [Enterococcus hirae]|nr:N-acetylmuramoyl-L-alanine amidase [Enterococcus hirae]